jgi:hypothetical protein
MKEKGQSGGHCQFITVPVTSIQITLIKTDCKGKKFFALTKKSVKIYIICVICVLPMTARGDVFALSCLHFQLSTFNFQLTTGVSRKSAVKE